MSILGKSFKVVNNYKMKDLGIKVGDVLKVTETCKGSYNDGAVAVEVFRDGKVETLKIKPFSEYWCFFSEGMIEKGQLVEVESVVEDCTKCIDTGIKVSGVGLGEVDHKTKEHIKSVVTTMNKDLMKTLEERYNNWIVENIHVYELFCEFAIKAIQSGKKKISHWLIVNRLRWEVEIETKGTCYQDKDFKISNDYIAFLARDFMKDYPQYGEVFTIKQMKRV